MSLSVLSPSPRLLARALVVAGLAPLLAAAVLSTFAPSPVQAQVPQPNSTWVGTGNDGDRFMLEFGRYGETWLTWEGTAGFSVSMLRAVEAADDKMVFEDAVVSIPSPSGRTILDSFETGTARPRYCSDLRYTLLRIHETKWIGVWTSESCQTKGTMTFAVPDDTSSVVDGRRTTVDARTSTPRRLWAFDECGVVTDMRWSGTDTPPKASFGCEARYDVNVGTGLGFSASENRAFHPQRYGAGVQRLVPLSG